MKYFLALLVLSSISLKSNAGVGGGGVGPRPETGNIAPIPKIVFNFGNIGGKVHFAQGHLINGQWSIQNSEIKMQDLYKDINLSNALKKSREKNDWTLISN